MGEFCSLKHLEPQLSVTNLCMWRGDPCDCCEEHRQMCLQQMAEDLADVPTPEQTAALAEYEHSMRIEVIPEILRVLKEREEAWRRLIAS